MNPIGDILVDMAGTSAVKAKCVICDCFISVTLFIVLLY